MKNRDTQVIVTLPTETLTERALTLGNPEIDERASWRTLLPGSSTLVVGDAGSGRTSVVVHAAVAAVDRLQGTRRKVIFVAVEDHPNDIVNKLETAGLTHRQIERHVRIARASTVEDLAYVVARVSADAVIGATNGRALGDHVPDLLIVDDAGALTSNAPGVNGTSGRAALRELLARVNSGTFFAEARAAVGSVEDKLGELTSCRPGQTPRTGHRIASLVTRRVRVAGTTTGGPGDRVSRTEVAEHDLVVAIPRRTGDEPVPTTTVPMPKLQVVKSRGF